MRYLKKNEESIIKKHCFIQVWGGGGDAKIIYF